MKFRVTVLPRAQQDIDETYRFIAEVQQQPLVAARWVDGIEAAIRSLSTRARRGAAAREQGLLGVNPPIQQILFHQHRILYAVTGDRVDVLHIRRGSRRNLDRGDV